MLVGYEIYIYISCLGWVSSPFVLIISFVRYIKVVKIYFLPVGHTHGQIDQLFSVYSTYLKWNPAKTLAELCQNLYLAYNNPKKKYKVSKKKKIVVEEAKEVPKVPVRTEIMDSVVDR